MHTLDCNTFDYDQMFAEGSPWREGTATAPSAAPEIVELTSLRERSRTETVELRLAAGSYPEIVAAEVLKELARTVGFSTARIGQMKMAVRKAVIAAAETAADPSDRIHIRYVVKPYRLEVFVHSCETQPDARPADDTVADDAKPPALKGWGLRLIYTLANDMTTRKWEVSP